MNTDGGRPTSQFSFKKRLRVYMRDCFTCRYCDRAMNPLSDDLTIDHIDPVGGDEDANLVTACRSCNSAKGRRSPVAWSNSRLPPAPVPSRDLTPGEILDEVTREHGVSTAALQGPARSAHLVHARREAARRLRAQGRTLQQIARILGRKDHTTIINLLDGDKRARVIPISTGEREPLVGETASIGTDDL